MEIDRSIIISIPELRLSLNVLGCGQWDDLPMLDTGDAVEQRIMNAFLQLVQKGCFLLKGEKYVPEQRFRQVIRNIGQADKVYYLYAGEYIIALIYEKESVLTVLSPDWGKREQCRISIFSHVTLSNIQEQYSVISGNAVQTRLKEYGKPPEEKGIYNLRELSFYMGDFLDWEETE